MTQANRPAPAKKPARSHNTSDNKFTDPSPFDVDCPDCHAIAGCQCINSVTERPLARALAHPRRIVASQKAVK